MILIQILFYFAFIQAKIIFLDVRTPSEFSVEHVSDAKNVDWSAGDFEKKVENIFKHDLTISQRDALIRDMRFFISKEFKTMIGGNKKSKKKRSSRKK